MVAFPLHVILASLLLAAQTVEAQYYYPRRRHHLATGVIIAIAIGTSVDCLTCFSIAKINLLVCLVVPLLLAIALFATIRRRRRSQGQSGPVTYVTAPPPPYAPPPQSYAQPQAPGFFGRVFSGGNQKEVVEAPNYQGSAYGRQAPDVTVPQRAVVSAH